MQNLKARDRITTLFYIFDAGGEDIENEDIDEYMYAYETFTIGANPVFEDIYLPDGNYFFMFEMEDAMGKSTQPDIVIFTLEDGEIFTWSVEEE
jgi:hypothetical protein